MSKKIRIKVFVLGYLRVDEKHKVCRKTFFNILNRYGRQYLRDVVRADQLISNGGDKDEIIERIYKDPRRCLITRKI